MFPLTTPRATEIPPMSENHEADIAIHMDKQTFEVHQASMTGTQLRGLPTP